MRDPKIVLRQLSGLREDQKITNIYCNLYNPEFYKIAYENICKDKKINNENSAEFSFEKRINNLIQSLRDKTYQPTNLLKNINSKPNLNDKLVQEIIRIVLEAIYEHTFLDSSHGFRPEKNCHTALLYIKQKCQGTKWWINCNSIKEGNNKINHEILLNTINKRIKEQKFIHLINLFLKAGYIDNSVKPLCETYSGTEQKSIISPILTNIYFNSLDKFMYELTQKFNCGTKRKTTKEYRRLESQKRRYYISMKNGYKTFQQAEEAAKKFKDYVEKNSYLDQYDPDFRRLSYVRYMDKILIGVIGSKNSAVEIKNEIIEFLNNSLKLDLSNNIEIIHNSNLVRFLGYDIEVSRSSSKKTINGSIILWLPYEIMKDFIINNRYGKFTADVKTNKLKLQPIHRPELINLDELEILLQYNCKMKGLYNYYRLASNINKLNGFNYICQLSFFKTLACKYKTSSMKLYANKNYNHQKNGAHIGITYNDKFYEFFNGPFKVVKNIIYDKNIDNKL